MRDVFDRCSNRDGGIFVVGLLAGAALGVGLGMLFAPKSGSALRSQLSTHAGSLANQARRGYRRAANDMQEWTEQGKQAAGDLTDRGKDLYGEAREAVSRGAEEAQKYVRDAADAVSDAAGGPRRG